MIVFPLKDRTEHRGTDADGRGREGEKLFRNSILAWRAPERELVEARAWYSLLSRVFTSAWHRVK